MMLSNKVTAGAFNGFNAWRSNQLRIQFPKKSGGRNCGRVSHEVEPLHGSSYWHRSFPAHTAAGSLKAELWTLSRFAVPSNVFNFGGTVDNMLLGIRVCHKKLIIAKPFKCSSAMQGFQDSKG